MVRHAPSKELRLACLGPGQFFGEVELTLGGQAIAHVQAAERGAELALLSREVFYTLIDGSPLGRHAVRVVAEPGIAGTNDRHRAALLIIRGRSVVPDSEIAGRATQGE